MEDVKPCYPNKRGTSQVVRSTQLTSPTGPAKCKWYAPHFKICRDRLKWCGPPWISTTNKSSFTMGNDRIPSQSAEQSLKSELSVLPRQPSLLPQRSPAQLSILTARTTVKQNTIYRHPDCTTYQVNLNMI